MSQVTKFIALNDAHLCIVTCSDSAKNMVFVMVAKLILRSLPLLIQLQHDDAALFLHYAYSGFHKHCNEKH